MWYGDHMTGYGWGMMLFMALFWLLVLVVIIGVVWSLARGRTTDRGGASDKTPLQILEERYARGEVDKEEFEQKRRDLKH